AQVSYNGGVIDSPGVGENLHAWLRLDRTKSIRRGIDPLHARAREKGRSKPSPPKREAAFHLNSFSMQAILLPSDGEPEKQIRLCPRCFSTCPGLGCESELAGSPLRPSLGRTSAGKAHELFLAFPADRRCVKAYHGFFDRDIR